MIRWQNLCFSTTWRCRLDVWKAICRRPPTHSYLGDPERFSLRARPVGWPANFKRLIPEWTMCKPSECRKMYPIDSFSQGNPYFVLNRVQFEDKCRRIRVCVGRKSFARGDMPVVQLFPMLNCESTFLHERFLYKEVRRFSKV